VEHELTEHELEDAGFSARRGLGAARHGTGFADMSAKLSKHAAKAQAKAKSKSKKSNFNSPSMQRKAEAASSGKNSSVEMVEDTVRAVEGSVMKELEVDGQLKDRLASLQAAARNAIGDNAEAQKRLSGLTEKIRELRKRGASFVDANKKALHAANMAQSELMTRNGSCLMPQDKQLLEETIKEAEFIAKTIDDLGSQRSDILSHVLNGLANVKVAQVEGVTPKPQVLQHLFAFIHEQESMQIPHNNAQVRLKHCLGICSRILGAQVTTQEVDAFAAIVRDLEALNVAAGSTADAPPQAS